MLKTPMTPTGAQYEKVAKIKTVFLTSFLFFSLRKIIKMKSFSRQDLRLFSELSMSLHSMNLICLCNLLLYLKSIIKARRIYLLRWKIYTGVVNALCDFERDVKCMEEEKSIDQLQSILYHIVFIFARFLYERKQLIS